MITPVIPEGSICGGMAYNKESSEKFTQKHFAFMYSQIANYLIQKNAKHLVFLEPCWNEEKELFQLIGYGQPQ